MVSFIKIRYQSVNFKRKAGQKKWEKTVGSRQLAIIYKEHRISPPLGKGARGMFYFGFRIAECGFEREHRINPPLEKGVRGMFLSHL